MLEICPFCSRVIAVASGPKSHTFTVILAVFPLSQDGVIHREKVYSLSFLYNVTLFQLQRSSGVLIKLCCIILFFKISICISCCPSIKVCMILAFLPHSFPYFRLISLEGSSYRESTRVFWMWVLKIDLTFKLWITVKRIFLPRPKPSLPASGI